jgi:TonB family protein
MKIKSIILSAAILGGLLSVSSFANVIVSATPAPEKFEAPVPTKVVSPTGLLPRFAGETITLSLLVDETGQPHNVQLARGSDMNLTQRLLPAVAQWKFTPAKKNGVPVPARIVLPVQLVNGRVS